MERFVARGKRGIVSAETRDGIRVAVKKKRPESSAIGRLEIEAKWIKELNKHSIGPRFVAFEEGKLVTEFIEGELIGDYVRTHDAKAVRKVILNVLEQCRRMDEIGVNKEEMHRPVKHIIVRDDKPVLIDFERCHYTIRPKNVTQFIQFLTSSDFGSRIKDKGISIDAARLREAAEEYKQNPDKRSFRNIRKQIA